MQSYNQTAILTGAILLLGSLSAPVLAEGPLPSFEDLCAARGVVKCEGFETQDDVNPYLIPDSRGNLRPSVDTTVAASGRGSLKYTIPPRSTGNSSGAYLSPLGANFGAGDSFYVSFKQRFSKEMLNTHFGGDGWKQVIIHSAGSSCAAVEITTQNIYHRGFPQLYSRCGADHFTVKLSGGDYLLQQGDYNCHYQAVAAKTAGPKDCSMYRPDEWITFYYEIHVGEWGKPNSSVRAYIAYEGEPLKQFIDIDNYVLRYNDSPTDTFARIQLTPYNTNKPSDRDHPTATTWYDDLIVSREPIFSSVSGVRPLPPTDVDAK